MYRQKLTPEIGALFLIVPQKAQTKKRDKDNLKRNNVLAYGIYSDQWEEAVIIIYKISYVKLHVMQIHILYV